MTTSKHRRVQITAVLVVLAFVLVRGLFWALPNVFEPWNAQTVDQLFTLRSSLPSFVPPYDSTVVHVDISDATLSSLRHSYLNRSQYAQVVRNLTAMGVGAIGLDFIFPARLSAAEDSTLVDAVRGSEKTYVGIKLELAAPGERTRERVRGSRDLEQLKNVAWQIDVSDDTSGLIRGTNPLWTFSELADAARGLGYLSLRFDRDRVFRRVPLLARTPVGFVPSFPFRIVCDYLSVSPHQVLLAPGESITLKQAHAPGRDVHDIVIPIDHEGYMLINYAGPWERMKHYDFADVLKAADDQFEMQMLGEEFVGKIVIVSDVSTGSSDVGRVPTDANFPLSGLHANVLNTILTGNFLRELSDSETTILEAIVLAVVFLLAVRIRSMRFAFIGILVFFGYVAAAAIGFLEADLIVNILRPSLMILLAVGLIIGNRYFLEAREKAVLRRSFEAYFPPSVVRKIMLNPSSITQAGQKKELTILFSDIKGFTTYAASEPPDQIQRLLNEYFDAMVEIVFKYEGTVDKFIGDGLMVFFGDPEPQQDHAVRCVRAAIEMQKRVRELRARWQSESKMSISIRIGINTGLVVVGNMGSARRLSYTVLGSEVNLAQRLEANAPPDGILISPRTSELVKDSVRVLPPRQIQVKGLEEPITVYEVPVEQQMAS